MFLFFYGENGFLLRQKVKEIEGRHKAAAGGDLNLQKIDGENINFEEFAGAAQAVPLLATSRLIEVSNIFQNKDRATLERVKAVLDKIPPSTVIVFIETNTPDKRLGLFKALNIKGHAVEFKNLSSVELDRFIKDEFDKNSISIDTDALVALKEYVGEDLWQLSSEIEKLINFCTKKVSLSDVEEVVTKNVTGNVFDLIDSIASGNKRDALVAMQKILLTGEPVLKVMSVINYQLRVIAQIKSALEQASNNYQIAKICSISPFQVMKNQKFAKALTWENISHSYETLVFFDESIKSGKIKDEEGLKELVISL